MLRPHEACFEHAEAGRHEHDNDAANEEQVAVVDIGACAAVDGFLKRRKPCCDIVLLGVGEDPRRKRDRQQCRAAYPSSNRLTHQAPPSSMTLELGTPRALPNVI